MPFVLRFVQKYHPKDSVEFMRWEALFAAMEQRRDDLPKGRRSQPVAGRLPTNSLIWECEFETPAEAQAAIVAFSNDEEHQRLFAGQAAFITEAYTEINEVLTFGLAGEPEP